MPVYLGEYFLSPAVCRYYCNCTRVFHTKIWTKVLMGDFCAALEQWTRATRAVPFNCSNSFD